MKKQIYHFNLIEIILTVAVISFGVVVILGMLPKGLRLSRNIATVSYASEVVEQMGYYLQNRDSADIDDLPEEFAAVADNETIKKEYSKLAEGAVTGFTATGIHGVYKYADGVYVIVIGNTEEIDGEKVTNVVFSGLLRVAKGDSKNYYIKADHGSHGDDDGCFSTSGGTIVACGDEHNNYSVAEDTQETETVYMELSYPLSVDHESRSKSYYTFDIR